MRFLTVLPAYGRDYKSGKAALVDFNANKDFVTATFDHPARYINKEQIEAGTEVMIRFKKATTFVKVKL